MKTNGKHNHGKYDGRILDMPVLQYEYHAVRARGVSPLYAKLADRTSVAFNALHGPFVNYVDRVRIRYEQDDTQSFDDLAGEMFDESVNHDIPGGVRRLRSEKKALIERIDEDGVWGAVAEYLNEKGEWTECWSCWGFVGDDFLHSGYDTDAMRSCVDAITAIDDAKAFLGFEERVDECLCGTGV